MAELAENEEKFNLSVVAYHRTLVDPSFQLESSFFHLIVKYKKHTPWLCTAETANISLKVPEMAENERKSNILAVVHHQKLPDPSFQPTQIHLKLMYATKTAI